MMTHDNVARIARPSRAGDRYASPSLGTPARTSLHARGVARLKLF
jgi:hypothetical protein